MAACATVWEVAIADYERRLNRPGFASDLGPITRLFRHLRSTDPQRFWVATRPWAEAEAAAVRSGRPAPPRNEEADTDDEAIVGFGSAIVRGGTWFLSMLFVLPHEQAQGLGRALLARTFPGGRLPARGEAWRGVDGSGNSAPRVLATATDAAQPISNALYARFGIVPRMPVFGVVGRPERPGILPALPEAIRVERLDTLDPAETTDALALLDRMLLGYERAPDHRFYRSDGRIGYLFRAGDGAPLGYGYATRVGGISPVLVRDPELLTPVVGHLLRAVEPRGASSVRVSGATPVLLRTLLEAGLRIEGFPALLCWTDDFLPVDRYVLGSLALP